jgi:hypothetical protein
MQGLEQEKLGLLQLQRPNDTVAEGQQRQKMKLGVQDGGTLQKMLGKPRP